MLQEISGWAYYYILKQLFAGVYISVCSIFTSQKYFGLKRRLLSVLSTAIKLLVFALTETF